MIEGMKLEVN